MRSKNKTKESWRIVKSLTDKHINCKEDLVLDNDGELIYNPPTIATIFNNYFINSVEKVVNRVTKQDLNNDFYADDFMKYLAKSFQQPFSTINLKAVNKKEIFEIIKSLKWNTSPGYDEIPNWIVKLSFPFISSPLIYLCNRMLESGTFPTRLKYAQIFPLFKKGSRKEKSNYRPVAVLTAFSKIFEKVIFNRLLRHSEENNIVVAEQHGFRKNNSTDLAIFKLINHILTHLNSNIRVGGIFYDLKKAFDTVNHNILLSKLQFYGVKGKASDLIRSYLSDRYHRVTIRNTDVSLCFATWKLVYQGVPQGSILGPVVVSLLY